MTVPFVDLQAQYHSIKSEVDAAVQRVLDTSAFILGPEVEAFERAFSEYVGAKFCVGVSNGTAAIQLALTACGIGAGDEVIVPANTFFATAEAVSTANATPIARAERHNLIVVEDAAQAHGARYRGQRVGPLGRAGCFSFYPGKNLGAYGEGGAVVTNDADVARRVRLLRDHGSEQKYRHEIVGYNFRLEGIQGAVLGVKLKYLDGWNELRREHAARYRELLAPHVDAGSLTLQREMPYAESVYHLFVVQTNARDALQRFLSAAGVQTGIHYPVPVHLQPAYASLGHKEGDFPEAERQARRLLSLPMFAELTERQVAYVSDALGDFFSQPAAARA
jgi:dTDP-4-amino-4,6-dideoxygalactose transaminase